MSEYKKECLRNGWRNTWPLLALLAVFSWYPWGLISLGLVCIAGHVVEIWS